MSLAIDAQIVIIAQSFQFFHLFRKGYFLKCFSIFNSNLTPYGDAIAKKTMGRSHLEFFVRYQKSILFGCTALKNSSN